LLWNALRNRRLLGLKFRRQHPFGRFVVDFYCPELRMAIEVDGGVHDDEEVRRRDEVRQELIETYDVRFMRVRAENLEHDCDATVAMIEQKLRQLPPLHVDGEGVR